MISTLDSSINSIYSKELDPTIKQGIKMSDLVGQQHLFCRMCDTREGFIIVPIGKMILQPDGRITGYSHPNEGFWKPYEYGTVAKSEAFAFVGAGNGFIPSSTWQQTLLDMPIGYYCGEPELPQKLCLVPDNNNETPGGEKLIYVIASCLAFYQKTVPKLIKELLDEGITTDRIKIVVNGSDVDKNTTIDGVSYAFSKHNAFELSALYEAPLRWEFDYAMLIHDTNEIYPGFRRKVENFNRHLRWDYLPATPMARCLLGLYSFDFLQSTNSWLKTTDGISKEGAIIAEVAGEFIHRAKRVMAMGDPESNGAVRHTEWRETADFFNSGVKRVRRVFPTLNLHKFTHVELHDAKGL